MYNNIILDSGQGPKGRAWGPMGALIEIPSEPKKGGYNKLDLEALAGPLKKYSLQRSCLADWLGYLSIYIYIYIYTSWMDHHPGE